MSTLSQTISADKLVTREVKAETGQGWVVAIEVGTSTTLYLTKAEAVDLFGALAGVLKGETK